MDPALNLKETVFQIKALSNGQAAVIDQRSTVRFIDPLKLNVIDGFKSKLVHEHRILNIVDISKSGKYVLIGIPSKNRAALYLGHEKKLKTQIGMHRGDIESVAISDNEHYLATGGTDGKTFIYHASTTAVLMALPNHRDYVTCIAFNEKNSLVASGSFDKLIFVKNIATMSDAFTLIGHYGPIKKMQFLASDLLLSADKAGHIMIWDLQNKKAKYRLPKMRDEILDIHVTADHKFLFVSTATGQIGLYDLENYTQLTESYVKIDGRVNALEVIEEHKLLLYSTDDGYIKSHSLLENEEALVESMKEGDFEAAYKYVADNMLLTFSDHYKTLERIWADRVEKAKELLAANLKDEAYRLLAPFSNVPGKRTVVKTMMRDFVEFGKFKSYILNERYALAYSLAHKYPVYQETQEFKELEATWERQFAKAKRSILERTGEDKAREYLALFRGVSDKARLITALYDQRKVYVLFRSKLAQKDFLAVFSLAHNYAFLKELKEYKDLMQWADAIYIKINHHFKEHDYMSAIKLANAIKDFPEFKEEVRTLLKHSEVYLEFEQVLMKKDFDRLYMLLELYPFLADLPVVDTIDPKWNEVEEAVQKPIFKGDIKGILETVKEYLTVRYKRNHIIMFVKGAYIRQVDYAIKKKFDPLKIRHALETLYTTFGEDEIFIFLNNRLSENSSDCADFETLIPGDPARVSLNKLPINILEA